MQYIERTIYPLEQFPASQWEYMRFYEEHFDRATRAFAANSYNTVKALFRTGDPEGFGKPGATAMTRINDGWFGPDSYYMNHAANADYAALASPMREYCTHLTETVLATGHWMPQEAPQAVNRAIAAWLVDTELL